MSPDPRGFIKVPRATPPERDPAERVKDYGEIYKVLPEPELKRQASRCMGCGVPFCNHACPLGNLIPDWNDLTRTGRWREAIDQLHHQQLPRVHRPGLPGALQGAPACATSTTTR